MSKIGVIHYNWPGFSFQEYLKFAADCGCGFVELACKDDWDKDVEHPERNAERVRDEVRSYGLRVSALSAQNDFVQPDADGVRFQADRMKRVAGLTKILDEDAVIRSEGGAPKDSVPPEKWLDAMYECFSRCVEFAEQKSCGIAIDNHGTITNDGDFLYALIRKVNHPLVGTNLDTMNYRWYGHDVATCNRFYEMLAPYVLHTHVKDGFGSRADYRGAELGAGEIDLKFALECLSKAGYSGVYCAEYEGPEAKDGVGYRKCAAWLKENVR